MGDDFLRRLRRIFIVACGTSYHAGLIVSYAIEQLARVPVQIDVASEFRYRQPVFDPDTLVIGITQSGETADTLAAMRLAREAGRRYSRSPTSWAARPRETRPRALHARRSGDRRGGDKTHTAQVAACSCSPCVSPGRAAPCAKTSSSGSGTSCAACPSSPSSCSPPSASEEIARRYHDERFFLYLGRGMGYAVCLEGALKLKEISYIPTEAYAAGEMKHGPIALLDEESPVVVVADDGPVFPSSSAISKRCAPAAPTSSPWRPTATTSSATLARRALGAQDRPPSGADPHGDPAAAAGLPHRRHQGTECGPAAEPGQDGDGGVRASGRGEEIVPRAMAPRLAPRLAPRMAPVVCAIPSAARTSSRVWQCRPRRGAPRLGGYNDACDRRTNRRAGGSGGRRGFLRSRPAACSSASAST